MAKPGADGGSGDRMIFREPLNAEKATALVRQLGDASEIIPKLEPWRREAWAQERAASLRLADLIVIVGTDGARSASRTNKDFPHFLQLARREAITLGDDVLKFHPGLPNNGDADVYVVEAPIGLKPNLNPYPTWQYLFDLVAHAPARRLVLEFILRIFAHIAFPGGSHPARKARSVSRLHSSDSSTSSRAPTCP